MELSVVQRNERMPYADLLYSNRTLFFARSLCRSKYKKSITTKCEFKTVTKNILLELQIKMHPTTIVGECNSNKPVSGATTVTLYGTVWLTVT